jgi:hypothetical protein
MTGEDQVRGESLRARQMTLLVRVGDIEIRALTPYQQDAARGLYAQALAGFLAWLAAQYGDVQSRLAREHAELRSRALAEGNHPRTPGIVADLTLGLKYFLDFALASGVITAAEREQRWRTGWQALLEAAADQTQEILAQSPARRFLQLVVGIITSGQGHLASRSGREPGNPAAWGWREVPVGNGVEWQPRGLLLGWVDGDDVFLDPEVCFAQVQRLADEQGERLPLSHQQLYRRLKDQDLLASHEPKKTTTRRTLQGKERAVLHLRPATLSPCHEQGEQGGQGANAKNPMRNPPVSSPCFQDPGSKQGDETGGNPLETEQVPPVPPVPPVSGKGYAPGARQEAPTTGDDEAERNAGPEFEAPDTSFPFGANVEETP